MNTQQIQAFQQAAGTKVATMSYSIKILLFFLASVWLIWIFTSVMQMIKDRDIAFNMGLVLRQCFSGIAILFIVLILIN